MDVKDAIRAHLERRRTFFNRAGRSTTPLRLRSSDGESEEWIAGSYLVKVQRKGDLILSLAVYTVDGVPDRLPIGPAWNPNL